MKTKKLTSLLLTGTMLASMLPATVGASEVSDTQQADIQSYSKAILEVDGLQFKDLNSNGTLDVYEDWREDTDDRIADLLSQMTLDEKIGLLFHCMTAGQFSPTYPMDDQFIYEQDCPFTGDILDGRYTEGYSIWYYVNEYNITHFLDDATGTPKELAEYHNKAQQVAEESRLGIPITFSSNREYNAWGSYTDMPHAAFGTANDEELSAQLWEQYSKEMKAVGYHLTLNPYGVELGSWYGEDPNYLADLTALEIETMQSTGLAVCTKHFVGRGNPGLSFGAARSEAQLYENWMVPWQAAIDAGTEWIMTNTGTGLSNTVNVDYDKETMDYLRNTLGYDGVVVTDWGPVGRGTVEGITADGVDLSTLTTGELYTYMLENGVDQFGSVSVIPGLEVGEPRDISNWPDTLKQEVEDGNCSMDLIDRSATRILRTKFEQGLFENPYVDVDAALELTASESYIAEEWEITNNEELDAARNPEVTSLDQQLQAESAVLLKNDSSLLPLNADAKVYVTGDNELIVPQDSAAIAEYAAEVVDNPEDADVIFVRTGSLGDESGSEFGTDSADSSAESVSSMLQTVYDLHAAGKKVVIAADTITPNAEVVANSDAILYLTYDTTPDHGSTMENILTVTEPCVLADMLYGTREPGGMLVKEIARSEEQEAEQWDDLANDTGATDKERLYLMELVRMDPTTELPVNLGDPLFCYQFGMSYGAEANLVYDTLVVPDTIKAGETFTVSCVIRNDGAAGSTTAELAVDGIPQDTVFMAVNEGSFRIVSLTGCIEEAGTHTLTLGSLSAEVTVA